MLVSSLRSYSAHVFLRSSISTISCSLFSRLSSGKFLLHCFFQSTNPCCNVGFTDAQYVRDLLVVVPVQIEEDQRLVQWAKSFDELVKEPDFFWLAFRIINRF